MMYVNESRPRSVASLLKLGTSIIITLSLLITSACGSSGGGSDSPTPGGQVVNPIDNGTNAYQFPSKPGWHIQGDEILRTFLESSDGKILIATQTYLYRLNADLTLDQSFGTSGKLPTVWSTGVRTEDQFLIEAIYELPDHSFILGGGLVSTRPSSSPFTPQVPEMRKISNSGAWDGLFGTAGKVSFSHTDSLLFDNYWGGAPRIYDIQMTSGGEILFSGRAGFSGGTTWGLSGTAINTVFEIFVGKMSVSGNINASFGSFGLMRIRRGSYDSMNWAKTLQGPNGEIYVSASYSYLGSNYTGIFKANQNGSADTSGWGPMAEGDTTARGLMQDMILLTDGRLKVVSTNGIHYYASANGNYISTEANAFNLSGLLSWNTKFMPGIQFDPLGRVYVTGGGKTSPYTFKAARFQTNGALDTSFGIGGIFSSDFGISGVARRVAFSSPNQIYIGGSQNDVVNHKTMVSLVRLNGSGAVVP